MLYLDDGLILSDNEDEAFDSVIEIRADLAQAAVIVNEKKSNWLPTHKLQWLGFVLDAENNSFAVPAEKIRRIRHAIDMALDSHRFSARHLAKVVGKITSLYPALGNIPRGVIEEFYMERATSSISLFRFEKKSV